MDIVVSKNRNFPLMGISIILILGAAANHHFHHQESTRLISIIILGIAVFVFLWTAWESFIVPVLTITEEGVLDKRLGVGVLKWNDIESAQLEAKYENRYVCLKVREPDQYLAKLQPEKRKKVLAHHKLGFTGFNIDVRGTQVNLVELVLLIQEKSQKHK